MQRFAAATVRTATEVGGFGRRAAVSMSIISTAWTLCPPSLENFEVWTGVVVQERHCAIASPRTVGHHQTPIKVVVTRCCVYVARMEKRYKKKKRNKQRPRTIILTMISSVREYRYLYLLLYPNYYYLVHTSIFSIGE